MTVVVRLEVGTRGFACFFRLCPAQARHADRERTSGGHKNQQRRRQRISAHQAAKHQHAVTTETKVVPGHFRKQ